MIWKQDEEYDFDVLTLQDGFEVLKDTQNDRIEGSLLFSAIVDEEPSILSSFPPAVEEKQERASSSSTWGQERTSDSKSDSTCIHKDYKRFGKVQDRGKDY